MLWLPYGAADGRGRLSLQKVRTSVKGGKKEADLTVIVFIIVFFFSIGFCKTFI